MIYPVKGGGEVGVDETRSCELVMNKSEEQSKTLTVFLKLTSEDEAVSELDVLSQELRLLKHASEEERSKSGAQSVTLRGVTLAPDVRQN